jgi:hypothetical protein
MMLLSFLRGEYVPLLNNVKQMEDEEERKVNDENGTRLRLPLTVR